MSAAPSTKGTEQPKDPSVTTASFPRPVPVEKPRTDAPKAPQKTLRMVLHYCLSHDHPPHAMRAALNDWENETEDELKELIEHARAVRAGKPLQSFVMSAERMSAIVANIFGK